MLLPLLAALFAFAPANFHDPEGRLAELTARLQRSPRDARVWLERGQAYAALGELADAQRDLEAALRLEPELRDAHAAMAFVQARLGNDVAALRACRTALRSADAPALRRLAARALLHLGRSGEACTEFATALALEPRREPEHFVEFAQALAARGDNPAALAVLERGLTELGPVVALVDAANDLDVRAGRVDAALVRLAQLARHCARGTPIHERRVRLLAAAGRTDVGLPVDVTMPVVDASAALPGRAVPAARPLPTPTVVVPTGATWRYRDTGIDPGAGWQLPAYDDSAWSSGPAQLGYGDGDEATVVQSGPSGAHYITTWFRHTFSVVDPTQLPSPRVRVLCDDAVVVWLNGVEIGRWNLHIGVVGSISPASTGVSGAAENEYRTFPVPLLLLQPGNNVLAVEIHQVSGSSSDISFDCELLAGPGPSTAVRGPYLQNATPSSMTVRWRTDQPTETQLWLGSSAATLQSVVFDATPKTEHSAVASGLLAETTYSYRIGDAAGPFATSPVAWLRTLPSPGAVRPMRAWILGDAGFGWSGQYAVRDAFTLWTGARLPDAMLMLGDNAYFTGTDAEYQAGVFDVYGQAMSVIPTWSTLGNHDAGSASSATQSGVYYDVFALPTGGQAGGLPSGTEAYYSFDRGHVHFVCLDSMDSDRTATGAMMTWLQADLAATSARWIVAFFHHPPYTFGSHNSDNPADSAGRMADMRAIALPILEAGGVDLVLSGHSHNYERSMLLNGHFGTSSTLQPGMVLDRGDGRVGGDGSYGKATTGHTGNQGAVYVVAGSAGSTGGGPLNHPAMYVSLNRLGSFAIDVDGDQLDATFVGLAGPEDHFTLVKGVQRTLFREQPRISAISGGRQDYRLEAGAQHAGLFYVLVGAYGTAPGFDLFGVHIPLNPDAWLQVSLGAANGPAYPNSIGVLDGNGASTSAFVLPPLNNASLVGLELFHAYVVGDGVGFVHASNPVKVTLGL